MPHFRRAGAFDAPARQAYLAGMTGSASLRVALLGVAGLLLALTEAAAQFPPPRPPQTAPTLPVQPSQPAPPARPNRPPPLTLDGLLGRLAQTDNENEARGIAARIERIWSRSDSDTANLLMARATRMLRQQERDLPLAVELLDRILVLQPNWAEAWNKRATAFYLLGDHHRAMLDVRQAIALEPRHFSALAGLGHILAQLGQNKPALDAYRRALAIHPHLKPIREAAEKLVKDVEGLPI
jgi:tetratricopeptide (TPR) repeat protein